MRSPLLSFAIAVVRAWTRVYTWRMEPGLRAPRLAEIESDLWEFQQDPAGGRGLSPAVQVLARLLIGVGSDLCWRVEHAPLRHRKVRIVVAIAAALFVAGLWVSTSWERAELPRSTAPPRLMLTRPAPTPQSAAMLPCDVQFVPPGVPPPAAAGPFVLALALCFEAQGSTSKVVPPLDRQIFESYIQLRPSRPASGVWVPFDDVAERVILEDFRRLWETKLLENLSIDVDNYTFPNAVIGKVVAYHIEERAAAEPQPSESRR